MSPLTINGTDVATLGFRLRAAPGWLDTPGRQLQFTQRPRRPGGIQTGATLEQPRSLILDGMVEGSTVEATRDNVDALRALIMKTEPATIILPDRDTRYLLGHWQAHPVDPGSGPSMIQRKLIQRLEFLCLEPFQYETTLTNGTVDGGVNRLLLGSAPSFPVISLSGATNPTLTLKKYDGTTLATMGLTISTGGDTLVIDSANMTLVKAGLSVIATPITGDFLVLDPASAQNGVGTVAGDRPYITVSSGSGTVAYRRAWR